MFRKSSTCRYKRRVNLFRDTHSNTVSLFAGQRPAKIQDQGLWDSMELLTHTYRSNIYELAVIWELALNEALGMKRIFSIIME